MLKIQIAYEPDSEGAPWALYIGHGTVMVGVPLKFRSQERGLRAAEELGWAFVNDRINWGHLVTVEIQLIDSKYRESVVKVLRG